MRPNPQETADLVTFTEEILNEKLYFLCSKGIKVESIYIMTDLTNFLISLASDDPSKSFCKRMICVVISLPSNLTCSPEKES